MNRKKLKRTTVTLLCFGFLTGHSQQAFVASGGDAEGTEGSASLSVGALCFTSADNTIKSLNQYGVQHPHELFVTAIEETANNFTSVFPNPVTDELIIKIEDFKNENLLYQLYDIQGKLVESKSIIGDQTRINTTTLLSSVYFLKVIQSNKQIQFDPSGLFD